MSDIREWADRYPGDPEALQDALVLEIERLQGLLDQIQAHVIKPSANFPTDAAMRCAIYDRLVDILYPVNETARLTSPDSGGQS